MDTPAKGTKHDIAQAALGLFLTQGYEATTMKQLSELTGKSLGNINYHFRRKEDILMFLHRSTIEIFIDEILEGSAKQQDPWLRYITLHSAYLYMLIKEPAILELYISATRLPSARLDYIHIFNDLFLSYIDVDTQGFDKRDVFMKTAMLCGGEFEMISLYSQNINEYNIDYLLGYPIRAFLLLFSFSEAAADRLSQISFSDGKKLAEQYWKSRAK